MGYHTPIMVAECMQGLRINPNGIYVDLTFGGGGHTQEILRRLNKNGRVFAFDKDPDTRENVPDDNRLQFIEGDFRFFKNYLRFFNIDKVDGIMADLGISSHHLEFSERGFSFRYDSQLDMRMDPEQKLTAAEIVNNYNEKDLISVFKDYGEIKNPYKIIDQIVKRRKQGAISTVRDFLDTINPCIPEKFQHKFLAKVFQALRIEVNDEISHLEQMLNHIPGALKKGGRFVVITFHSLEDRVVKYFIKTGNVYGKEHKDLYGNMNIPVHAVNKKVIVANQEEIKQNPRARSAKLRIAEKY